MSTENCYRMGSNEYMTNLEALWGFVPPPLVDAAAGPTVPPLQQVHRPPPPPWITALSEHLFIALKRGPGLRQA